MTAPGSACALHGAGGEEQHSRAHAGIHQFHRPSTRDERRHKQRADDGGVEQDPGAEARGEHLDVGVGSRGEGGEGEEQDQRGARDEAPGSPDALDDGPLVSPVRSYSSRTRVRMKTS